MNSWPLGIEIRRESSDVKQPCVAWGQHLPWCIWQTVLSERKMDTWKGAVSRVSLPSNFDHPWCKYGIAVCDCELFTPCWLHQRDIFMCNINLWQGIWYCRVYGRIFAASITIALPRCEHAMCQCRFLPGNARYLLGFGCWEVMQSAAGKLPIAELKKT